MRFVRFFPVFLAMLLVTRSEAGTATIAIDFGTVRRTLSPLTFSMVESGYGANGTQLPRQPAQQRQIVALKIAMMRVNLGYLSPGDPASGIVCLAGGADHSIRGDDYVAAIRAAGAKAAVRVQMDAKISPEIWTADAANLVRHFNRSPATRIERWVIGNEPDGKSGMSVAAYSDGFIAMFRAMKAIDPAIAIGGPATAKYEAADDGFLRTFLRRLHAAGIVPDFVDFHSYGTGTNPIADAALLAVTARKYRDEPADLRRFLVSLWGEKVGGAIPIEIGEWNLSWRSDARQLQHFASVWGALALCHMIESGTIGRLFADKNGPLGAVCEVANPTVAGVTYPGAIDAPQPIYHAIGMFTGESLFPHFGRTVVATSVDSTGGLIEVVASDGPKNIVVVNASPDEATHATFRLSGAPRPTVAVWQKHDGDLTPVKLDGVDVAGDSFEYSLAPYTVTTFVVTPAAN